MSEKKDRKSKREGALSNVCILIDDTSVAETKPLKVSIGYACMFILGRHPLLARIIVTRQKVCDYFSTALYYDP